MLEMWLSSEGGSSRCNWETVINALKSGQSDSEHQVADDIYNPRSIKVASYCFRSCISYNLYVNSLLYRQ